MRVSYMLGKVKGDTDRREERGAQDTVENYYEDMTTMAARSYENQRGVITVNISSALMRRHLEATSLPKL